MATAGMPHGEVCVNVASPMHAFVRRGRLGRVFGNDTGFVVARNPDTVRAPDIAFVRAGRLPEGPPPQRWDQAPDLVVEVVSPNDRWSEIEDKTQDWLTAGTEEVWLVDPARREVKVVTREGSRTRRGGQVVTSAVLPGFEFAVEELFATG